MMFLFLFDLITNQSININDRYLITHTHSEMDQGKSARQLFSKSINLSSSIKLIHFKSMQSRKSEIVKYQL